jgi:hypothetical protein
MTSTPPIISTNTPTFSFSPALANGSYVPCMRVDGVDSPIGINSSPPPAYSGQVTI